MENYRGNLFGIFNVYETFRLVWFIVRGKKPKEGATRRKNFRFYLIIFRSHSVYNSCVRVLVLERCKKPRISSRERGPIDRNLQHWSCNSAGFIITAVGCVCRFEDRNGKTATTLSAVRAVAARLKLRVFARLACRPATKWCNLIVSRLKYAIYTYIYNHWKQDRSSGAFTRLVFAIPALLAASFWPVKKPLLS